MKKLYVLAPATIAISLPIIFWSIFWSTSTPIVMGDEFRFAQQALTLRPDQVTFGNFISHSLINLVHQLTSDWYSGLKLINSILAALIAIPAYIIFRRFSTVSISAFGAIFVVLAPVQIYAATALPEIPYYLFLISSLACYAHADKTKYMAISAGFFAGLAALTKPHAFVFIIAIFLASLVWLLISREKSQNSLLWISSAFLLSSLIFRFGLGLALFGQGSLNPFGGYIDVFATAPESFVALDVANTYFVDNAQNPSFWQILLAQAPVYFLAFAHIFLIPITQLLIMATNSRKFFPSTQDWTALFSVILFSVTLSYVGLAWIFSALVTFQGDDHAGRILFRYVDFLFPILLIFSIHVSHQAQLRDLNSRLVLWSAIGISGFSGIVLSTFSPSVNPADSTILSLFFSTPLPWLVVACIFGYLLLRENKKWDFRVISSFSSLVIVLSLIFVADVGKFFNRELSYLKKDSELALEEIDDSKILFISSSQFQGTSAMFYTESFNSHFLFVAPYSQIDVEKVPVDYERLVLVGSPESASINADPIITELGISTFVNQQLDQMEHEFGYQSDAIGLVTNWGYWIDGSKITARFDEDFRPGDKLLITIRVHPLFDGREIDLTLGGATRRIALEDTLEAQTLEIDIQEVTAGEIELDALRTVDLAGPNFYGSFTRFSLGILDISRITIE